MAILCGPAPVHHPSCPARYDALGCICPREVVTTAPAASAGLSAHGAATGAVPLLVDQQLVAAEQASIRRYMAIRQQRVDALRPARQGVA
jgi:hypothetical protein